MNPGADAPRDVRPSSAYRLPDALRLALAEPMGPILDTASLGLALHKDDVILAVGDVVATTLQDLSLTPALFICDYKTQRGADPELEQRLGNWGAWERRVKNPAGTITREAWDAVREALAADVNQRPARIVVDGEEDLLGIPCFLEAPDGAWVVYGMPGRGAVAVHVDEAPRTRVATLLAGFDET